MAFPITQMFISFLIIVMADASSTWKLESIYPRNMQIFWDQDEILIYVVLQTLHNRRTF